MNFQHSLGQALGLREIDMVNLSSINATLKLLQCPRLGLSSVSIRQKFYRPDAMCRAAGDLPENAFIKYKGVLDQLEERLGGVDSTEFWTPILYKWELYPGACKSLLDFGHFVYANGTLKKFLLVQLYGEECGCCDKLHQAQFDDQLIEVAQRFLNLTTYLSELPAVDWVRATYISPQEPQITSAFFEFDNHAPDPRRPTESLVLHLTPAKLAPTLSKKECDMIEALVHSLGYSTGPREPVLRLNEGPPRVDWGKDMIQRVCSGCEEMFLLDKLFRCGGCKMIFYCSKACQQQNWSIHKKLCKGGR